MTAPVKCAPPANAPTPAERDACAPFLAGELEVLRPRVVVCLGAFGYAAACRHYGVRPRPRFGHGVEVAVPGGPTLLCSFHPSQQNTFTGRLTEPMLDAVFARAVELRPATVGQAFAARVNAVWSASATSAWAERESSSSPNIEKKPWIWPSKRTCVVGTPASARARA